MERFPVCHLGYFKSLAKKLKKELDLVHGHSLEQLSIAHGYAGYYEVVTILKRTDFANRSAPNSLDHELWLTQLSQAFHTEFEPVICGVSSQQWLARICGVQSDSDERV